MRRSDVDSRSLDVTFRGTSAEREQLRRTDHEPYGRHTIRDHYTKLVFGDRIWKLVGIGQQVCVHIDEARDQVLAGSIDTNRVLWDLDLLRVADLGDDAVANDHGLIRQHSFAIHRDNIHVDERRRLAECGNSGKCNNECDLKNDCDHKFLWLRYSKFHKLAYASDSVLPREQAYARRVSVLAYSFAGVLVDTTAASFQAPLNFW